MQGIDWTDADCMITEHFSVMEAIWLPSWNRLANESDGLTDAIQSQVYRFFRDVMEPIRSILSTPINIHCGYRCVAYNSLPGIRGAPDSAHLSLGPWAASDFSASMGTGSIGTDCDRIREILMPYLDTMKLRMEDRGPKAPWVHIDNKPLSAGANRYFKP